LNPDEKPVNLEYLVVGGSWGGEKFALLAAEGDGHVTSTVGVEHLTHRIISAAIWLAIVIFFAYGAMLRKNAIPGKDSEAPTAGSVSIAMQNAVNAAAAQARPAADNSGAGLMARVRPNGEPMRAASGPRTFGRRTS
jgi:hypothetical protein